MNRKMTTQKERIEYCYKFKASRKWLNAIMADRIGSKYTERDYSRGLYAYCEWIGKNPDQLIKERNEETEDKVREFTLMLKNTRNISKSTIATKYIAVLKSFFKHNKKSLDVPIPKHSTHRRSPHTTEEIKSLMQIANVRERAIITVLKDSGMSREDVVKLNYGDIKTEYENDKQFIHIKTVRTKEAIEYDTFIGKNAVECLKAYLDTRKRKGCLIKDDSPLLATLSNKRMTPETLTEIFQRLSRKAGFKTSPHRFRKYFESHLGLTVPTILIRFWMGHSLGVESHYFLPPIQRQKEKYVEAYKEIDIFKAEVSELEIRKQRLMDMLRMKDLSEKQIGLLELELMKASTQKELDEVRDHIGKEQLEPMDCQKLIEPSELEHHLKNGWRYIAQVNGKIVISNE